MVVLEDLGQHPPMCTFLVIQCTKYLLWCHLHTGINLRQYLEKLCFPKLLRTRSRSYRLVSPPTRLNNGLHEPFYQEHSRIRLVALKGVAGVWIVDPLWWSPLGVHLVVVERLVRHMKGVTAGDGGPLLADRVAQERPPSRWSAAALGQTKHLAQKGRRNRERHLTKEILPEVHPVAQQLLPERCWDVRKLSIVEGADGDVAGRPHYLAMGSRNLHGPN